MRQILSRHRSTRLNGKLRWRFATDLRDGRNSAIYSFPVPSRGGVYLAAGEGQPYGIDGQLGELKWKLRPSEGSELLSSPASAGAYFFLVTEKKGYREPSLVAIGLK